MQFKMEKEFVPYELAVKLKALGFDEECFGLWNINNGKYQVDVIGTCKYSENFKYREVLAPTFSQAFRWFDDNTECSGYIVPSTKEGHFDWLIRIDWEEEIECEEAYSSSSRIEAELTCLTKLIEILEN